jgi:hypothetical protein
MPRIVPALNPQRIKKNKRGGFKADFVLQLVLRVLVLVPYDPAISIMIA